MSLVKLRAPFIFYCDLPNHTEIKEIYYPELLNIFDQDRDDLYKKSWNCKVLTTHSFEIEILREKLFLDSVVWKPLDQMLTEVDLNVYPTNSRIQGIWANFYEKDFFQEVHDHVGVNGCHFSGIYIIDQNGDNKTSFIHNNFGILDNQIHTKNMDDIKEGTVLIFPSNLLHYVNPTDSKRCTISFNIKCEF